MLALKVIVSFLTKLNVGLSVCWIPQSKETPIPLFHLISKGQGQSNMKDTQGSTVVHSCRMIKERRRKLYDKNTIHKLQMNREFSPLWLCSFSPYCFSEYGYLGHLKINLIANVHQNLSLTIKGCMGRLIRRESSVKERERKTE